MPQVGGFFLGAFGFTSAAATGAFAAGLSAGAAFGGSLLGGVAVKLLSSVALSALATALVPKQKAPGIQTEATASGGTNPCAFILGKYATGGVAVCPPMSHSNPASDANNYWLTYVIEVSDIAGVTLEGLIIDGERLEIGAETYVLNGVNYGRKILGRLEGAAFVRFHDGSQVEADPFLLRVYADYPERPWQADMIGRGVAYAVLSFRYDRQKFNGFPSVRFEIGGVPLYDPRRDSSVGGDGAQRWGDRSTWAASENPAVQVYNILRGIRLPGLGRWGGDAAAEDLPLESWFAAMNVADAGVDRGDGVLEPQFRAAFEVSVDQEPASVIEELLRGASGQLAELGGVWKPRLGAPALPVFFFSDEDLIISAEESFAPFQGLAESFNAVHASYPDPEQLWEAREAPPRYNAAWEAEDGDRQLVADLSLPATPYPAQVQRVMRAYIEEERRFRRHSLVLPPEAAVLEPLDVVAWSSARNGYQAKLFEVVEISDDLATRLQSVVLRERDPEDYDWRAEFALPSVAASAAKVAPETAAVAGFALAGVVLADGAGQARRAGLRLSWDAAAEDQALGLKWELRLAGGTALLLSGSTGHLAAGQLVLADGIIPGQGYEARASYVSGGRVRIWSDWLGAVAPAVLLGEADLAPAVLDAIAQARAEGEAARLEAAQAIGHADQAVADLRGETLEALELLDGDLGAARADLAAMRPDQRAVAARVEALSGALTSALLAVSAAQTRMADAGIHLDPESGRARIEAVSRLDGALSAVSLSLDALRSEVALRATHAELNAAISEAVLDPSQIPVVEDLSAAIGAAQLELDGLAATVAASASRVELEGFAATLTEARTDLDAALAALSNVVTRDEFDDAAGRLVSVEQTLSAMDGASYRLALSDAMVQGRRLDDAARASVQALLQGYAAREITRADLAYLGQDLRALVGEDRTAIANLRTELGVAIEDLTARAETEIETRASEDAALAHRLDTLDAALGQTASATALAGLSATVTQQGTAITAQSSQLVALSASVSANAAAISSLSASKVTASGAVAAVSQTISAQYGSLEALAEATAFAQASAAGISAGYLWRLNGQGVLELVSVSGGTGGATVTATIQADYVKISGLTQIDTAVVQDLAASSAFLERLVVTRELVAPNAISDVIADYYAPEVAETVTVSGGTGYWSTVISVGAGDWGSVRGWLTTILRARLAGSPPANAINGQFRWRVRLNEESTIASGSGLIVGNELHLRETVFRGAAANVYRITLELWLFGLPANLTILSRGVIVTPIYK